MSGFEVVPVTFRQACAFVTKLHRHNKAPRGHKFSIGLEFDGVLVGVVMVGRPVARMLDDGRTAEVNRTCTDGTPNANSMLYGAAWRAARAMGYRRAVTYTQASESGVSLRAAGWVRVAVLAPTPGWTRESRPREDHGADGIPRMRWEIRS